MPEFAYDPTKSFRSWLKTVTQNAWRKAARQGAHKGRGQNGDLAEIAGRDEGREFEEAEYRRHLVGRALEIMQSEFQSTTWRACWASVVEGKPADEIARELGISRNAVYLAKSRVIRLLHHELDGMLD
jgi:RNA polymerase sigma-70 factor, ECF subfamily